MRSPRSLLLLGLETAFGGEIARICARRRLAYVPGRMETVRHEIERIHPWAVVDACGMIADSEPLGPDLPLLSFCLHGQTYPSKSDGRSLYIRTSDLFGGAYLRTALDRLMLTGEALESSDHTLLLPTYVPDLIDVALDLLIDRASGIWHLSHGLAVAPADLAANVATRLDAALHTAEAVRIPGLRLTGPGISVLLPPLEDALERWLDSLTRVTEPAEVPHDERNLSIASVGAVS